MTNMTYEGALKKLDKICEQLDKEDISLENLVQKYEKAKELYEFCERKLKEIENAIDKIDKNE